ncbi:MAG: hypothetical protein AAFP20_10265 [Cyanobacteria bacterium J06614_10]
MRQKFNTVYEILDELRERPAMFLGNNYIHSPLTALQAFICGLSFSNIDGGEPSFWGFNRWVTSYVNNMSKSLPWEWLAEERGEQQGFQDFFSYLEKYHTCQIVQVATPTTHNLVPRFRYLDSDLSEIAPPIPNSIHIGQFAPSEVFFLAETYGHNMEKDFPYHTTIEDAIASAQLRWSIPETKWNITQNSQVSEISS